MAVLETRKAGTVTCPITVRLAEDTHQRLKLYALKTQQSMALAMDELILKGTANMAVTEKKPQPL